MIERTMFTVRHLTRRFPINDMHPAVRAFILSEVFFWSGWNFIIPILSVFVISSIPGATIQSAATAFTCHLLVRICVELFVSNQIGKASNMQRIVLDCAGMLLLSLAYLGIAFFNTIESLYFFYILAGVSFGVSSPAKLSLFSKNLAKNSEATAWGIYDAVVLLGMATATSIGGYIANIYGFPTLFKLASAINFLGIVPYLLYVVNVQQLREKTIPLESD